MTNVGGQIGYIYGAYLWPDYDEPRYGIGFGASAAFALCSIGCAWVRTCMLEPRGTYADFAIPGHSLHAHQGEPKASSFDERACQLVRILKNVMVIGLLLVERAHVEVEWL
jgi:hypothetical protein